MAKERICNDCIHNNNGWCKARKTNKGLKDLIQCGFREEPDNIVEVVSLEDIIKINTAMFLIEKARELVDPGSSADKALIDAHNKLYCLSEVKRGEL